MSSYSKKYTNLKDDQKHLFLTWETGYKNLKVYYEGQLIQTVDSPGKLRKGVEFDHPELNKVELMFSTATPIIMQVKANGQKYYPENNIANAAKNDLSGLVYVFGILAALSFIGTLITVFVGNFHVQNVENLIVLIVEILIISIYTTSAIFISKGQKWAYFMGSITFIFLTVIYLYGLSLARFNIGATIFFLIRISIIYLILRRFKDVMRISKKVAVENPDLLDNSDF